MNRYRILEKEGISFNYPDIHKNVRDKYIPRFIVQEAGKVCIQRADSCSTYTIPSFDDSYYFIEPIKDLKEFTSLEEAREYKHKLELVDGIVRE